MERSLLKNQSHLSISTIKTQSSIVSAWHILEKKSHASCCVALMMVNHIVFNSSTHIFRKRESTATGIHELHVVVLTFHNYSSLDYFNKELCYFRPPCDRVTFIIAACSCMSKSKCYRKTTNICIYPYKKKIAYSTMRVIKLHSFSEANSYYLENKRNTSFVRSKYMHFW